MKKILVTTDLSEESKVAFAEAKKLAKVFDADITVLAVIEDPSQAAMVYAMEFPILPNADIRKQFREKVEDELSRVVETEFASMRVKSVVREAQGPVHSEVTDFAEKQDMDLIVLATHGRTGIKHLVIGSVAERIARNASCPVLVVPTLKKN